MIDNPVMQIDWFRSNFGVVNDNRPQTFTLADYVILVTCFSIRNVAVPDT